MELELTTKGNQGTFQGQENILYFDLVTRRYMFVKTEQTVHLKNGLSADLTKKYLLRVRMNLVSNFKIKWILYPVFIFLQENSMLGVGIGTQ